MKGFFVVLVFGLSTAGAAEVLIGDDFQSYGGNTRPKVYLAHNFPQVPDDPNNAVIGAEFGNTSNKVLRMATANEEGLAVADFPRITRAFTGVTFGSKGTLSLEFDYRNNGTASSWLYFALGNEGSSHEAVEAVVFNGTAIPDGGGMFIREGHLKRFPNGPSGLLRNLAKGTWYHAKLEIKLVDKTARLTVQDKASSTVYETDWIPCQTPWNDGDMLDQVIFGCVEGGTRARYKFEFDNLKVTYDPDAA